MARQKRRGKHEPQASVSPYFLSAIAASHALEQNRAQLRLLYLCYDKESIIFLTYSPFFSDSFCLQNESSAVSVLSTIIKHANFNQSQRLLECFK